MQRIIKHIRRWNIWRKDNRNSRLHKLLVLLGLRQSPTLNFVFLPEELWPGQGFYDGLISVEGGTDMYEQLF